MTQSTETVSQLTRPIIGIENRTPLEVFDIMCDRIDHAARISTNKDETIAKLAEAFDEMAPLVFKIYDAARMNEEWGRVVAGQTDAARELERVFSKARLLASIRKEG